MSERWRCPDCGAVTDAARWTEREMTGNPDTVTGRASECPVCAYPVYTPEVVEADAP